MPARSAPSCPRIVREVIAATTGTPPAGAGSTTAPTRGRRHRRSTSLPLLSLRRDFLLADLPHDLLPQSVPNFRFRCSTASTPARDSARWRARCRCSLQHARSSGFAARAPCAPVHEQAPARRSAPGAAGDRRVRELRVQPVPPAAPEPRHRRRHRLPLRDHHSPLRARHHASPTSRCIATRSADVRPPGPQGDRRA